MCNDLTSDRSLLHTSGVMLHHLDRWWLVESPASAAGPGLIHRLTGHLTPPMTDRMAGDARQADDHRVDTSLYPLSLCWSGDFTLAQSDRSEGAFDIDAYHGGDAPIPEIRRARIVIESTLHPVPSGFVSVLSALPADDRPVLAIRLSGYVCATFELLTARYMPDDRPKLPWRDISDESVGGSGSDILGWRYAEDWIKPTDANVGP